MLLGGWGCKKNRERAGSHHLTILVSRTCFRAWTCCFSCVHLLKLCSAHMVNAMLYIILRFEKGQGFHYSIGILDKNLSPQINFQLWYSDIILLSLSPLCPCGTLKEKGGNVGDLLIKQARSAQHTVQATDEYAQRVSIDEKNSLLITKATLKDQNKFSCMVVSESNLVEYPSTVIVQSKSGLVRTSLEIFSTWSFFIIF